MTPGALLRWLLELIEASAGPTLRESVHADRRDEAIELTVSGQRFHIIVREVA